MNPPLMARALLLAVAGDDQAEFVAGDLHEEFVFLCQTRGRRAGRRWYVWQVARSILALLGLRMRSGEVAHVFAATALGVAIPLLLLDRLWCFVYSQIPLKDGLHRAPGFLAANVICAGLCAAFCGATARSLRRAVAIAAAAALAAGFALWNSAGAAPALYVCVILLIAPASSLMAWRRFR